MFKKITKILTVQTLMILYVSALLPAVSAAQTCNGIKPDFGSLGDHGLEVVITGRNTHFEQGVTEVSFDNERITVVDIIVETILKLTVIIDIAENAPLERGNVTVTTGSEEMACDDVPEDTEKDFSFDVRVPITLSIGDGSGPICSNDNPVSISLENIYGGVKAVQVDLCDAGNYLTLSQGDNSCLTTDRTDGFICKVSESADGCVRVLLSNFSGEYIDAGEGEIFTLKYDVSDGAAVDNCADIAITNEIVSDGFGALNATLLPGQFCFLAGIDSDGDNVADCLDNCPNDPGKVEPGSCGCGNPETPDCGSTTATTTTTTTDNPGTPPEGGDSSPLPDISKCTDNSDCDDSYFCNGAEKCEDGRCVGGDDPCMKNETCDEDFNECVLPFPLPDPEASECLSDSDCDDGIFCNGEEECTDGECIDGQVPCDSEQICMENEAQCLDFQNISASSINRKLSRPVFREEKCTWLVLEVEGDDNFDPESSTVAIEGQETGCSGVIPDPDRAPFEILKFILIPLCIEREATVGQWKIAINTQVTGPDNQFEESINAGFEIE